MSQGRSRGKAKGVQEFRPYVTRSLLLLDQFADLEGCEADVKAAAQHLRRLSKLYM